jgi:predicted PurR-regulated permease PerM
VNNDAALIRLVAGDLFLRRLVEILPTLSIKKQAVDISHEIESNLSGYLVTISLMNAAVGIATGLATYFCGLADPILWGSVVFLLNYIPILGPLCGVAILFLAGLLTFDPFWQAALPAGIYLVIHLIEGESVTPMLLARRFILNPVLVIVSLAFWYWMWGVAGALLAVPMLATLKIVCDRIRSLMALGHFRGAEARS